MFFLTFAPPFFCNSQARLLPAVLEWAQTQGLDAKEVGGKEHGGMVRLRVGTSGSAAGAALSIPAADEATMIRTVFGNEAQVFSR